jgi:hypothetical protein
MEWWKNRSTTISVKIGDYAEILYMLSYPAAWGDNQYVDICSSNEDVAKIINGYVYSVSKGTATITGTWRGITKTLTIIVE